MLHQFGELGPDLYYWQLPPQFLGEKLSSYGGLLEFLLHHEPRPGREDTGDGEPLVEISVGDTKIKIHLFVPFLTNDNISPL